MFVKTKRKLLPWCAALGPLALSLGLVLGRSGNPALDFLSGFLTGFALVGNLVLAYLLIHSQDFLGD